MRIASLVPSATDIACELGLAHALVGVSHECDHVAARGLPSLTSSIIPYGLPPGEVDALVSNAVKAGQSLYRVDRAQLHALRPDVVITQGICDVCAVSGKEAACDLPVGAQLVTLDAGAVGELYRDLRTVGAATGALIEAEAAIARITARLDVVRARVAGRVPVRTLALEWGDPPYPGGHWVPELVEIAGGDSSLGATRVPSVRVTWESIAERDPEVIVFMPCGYHLEEARVEGLTLCAAHPELRAVREGRFWVSDATTLFSRCTPVVARAAEVLAAILHPDLFHAPAATEALRLWYRVP